VIRWHQTFDVGYVPNSVVPKVFMAVACDLRDDPNGLVDILSTDYVILFILVVLILDINRMSVIDFHVLALLLLMDNK
jgi:hypothetical protein